MIVASTTSSFNNCKISGKNPGINTDTSVIDLTMKISGKVWVDGSVGKENQYDGKSGEGDTPMSNVKVSLS